MKIVYLVHQFYPEFQAGTEKFLLNTARMAQKNGHKVHVLTYSVSAEAGFEEEYQGCLVRNYFYQGIPVTAFHYRNEPVDLTYGLEGRSTEGFFQYWLSAQAPDLVHVGHTMRVNPFITAAVELGIPYVVTATDFFLICPKVILSPNRDTLCSGPQRGESCRRLCPELAEGFISERLSIGYGILRKAAAVVVPSRFVAGILKNELPELKPLLNNHGIRAGDLSRNGRHYTNGDALTFGYIGNLAYHKGVHVLVKAFNAVPQEDARLLLFGSGEEGYVKSLKALTENDRRIEFRGSFSAGELRKAHSQMDVLVAPSVCYETYSLSVHEAMLANIPVIVSDLGGMTEKIENGVNGLTFKAGDVNELAEQLKKVSENPSLLNSIKQQVSLHTIIPTIEQEYNLYQRLYERIVG